MELTLLNSTIALCGYFTAAAFIDRPFYGRRRMQVVGFFMMFACFLPIGIAYDTLINDAIGALQFLYFFSSFWIQFGPNCTTFLVAGEMFPTDVRAFFHGISAACGQAGALTATQVFSRIAVQNTFYASAAAGIVGAVATLIFLPNTTGLSLAEVDRYNRYLIAGQAQYYHGEVVNPKYLSLFERWCGHQKAYDPDADAEQLLLQDLSGIDDWLPFNEDSEEDWMDEANDEKA